MQVKQPPSETDQHHGRCIRAVLSSDSASTTVVLCPISRTLQLLFTLSPRKVLGSNGPQQCQEAFVQFKAALMSADVLALPLEKGPFILDCGASDTGIGAVLSQIQNGIERPICYASQLYNRHEQNYNVTRKELLALITFVKKFRQYSARTIFPHKDGSRGTPMAQTNARANRTTGTLARNLGGIRLRN